MSDFTLNPMTMNDYDEVFALWHSISGFAMRSIDDSREGVERFLGREGRRVHPLRPRRPPGPVLSRVRAAGSAAPRHWERDGRVLHEAPAGGEDK